MKSVGGIVAVIAMNFTIKRSLHNFGAKRSLASGWSHIHDQPRARIRNQEYKIHLMGAGEAINLRICLCGALATIERVS